MRPDFKKNYLDKCLNFYNPDKFYSPEYPLYVPYEALITNQVSNLLLPGYAAGVSCRSMGTCENIPMFAFWVMQPESPQRIR